MTADESARQKATLKERAHALAKEPEQARPDEESMEVVEFTAANEKYGIESRFVREVQTLRDLTPVPCTPAFIAGIINVRGQILAVIDIKHFFELPDKGIADVHKVLILRNGVIDAGLLADTVPGVRTVSRAELQPSLPTLTGIRAHYLKGVTQEGLVILDADKILADKTIMVNEQIEA